MNVDLVVLDALPLLASLVNASLTAPRDDADARVLLRQCRCRVMIDNEAPDMVLTRTARKKTNPAACTGGISQPG